MELMFEAAELDEIRAAGDVIGEVVAQVWRDEFAPAGKWQTFTEYVLVEADRLHGVLDDLTAAVALARVRLFDTEARAGWSDPEEVV